MGRRRGNSGAYAALMDKDTLLRGIRETHLAIETAAAALDDGGLAVPAPDMEGWTRKDVLAHVEWWNDHSTNVIAGNRSGMDPYPGVTSPGTPIPGTRGSWPRTGAAPKPTCAGGRPTRLAASWPPSRAPPTTDCSPGTHTPGWMAPWRRPSSRIRSTITPSTSPTSREPPATPVGRRSVDSPSPDRAIGPPSGPRDSGWAAARDRRATEPVEAGHLHPMSRDLVTPGHDGVGWLAQAEMAQHETSTGDLYPMTSRFARLASIVLRPTVGSRKATITSSSSRVSFELITMPSPQRAWRTRSPSR